MAAIFRKIRGKTEEIDINTEMYPEGFPNIKYSSGLLAHALLKYAGIDITPRSSIEANKYLAGITVNIY